MNNGRRTAEALIVPAKGDFRGVMDKPPSAYRVTAAIPHLNTLDPLRACIQLLRHQSERPYIVVVDTGSPRAVCDKMEDVLRAEDVEIHYIRAHGYSHPVEPISIALDTAQSRCPTKYLFHTHADCFLRDRRLLEHWMKLCTANHPVLGYRMSPRDWITDDWEWMVGHTATLMFMPTIHRIGATWSWQRSKSMGIGPKEGSEPGREAWWPDTESGINYTLREAGITPIFMGEDVNYERQTDAQIDHVRSYPGSRLYDPEYHAKASGWMKDALSEARHRAQQWAALNVADIALPKYQRKTSPLPC